MMNECDLDARSNLHGLVSDSDLTAGPNSQVLSYWLFLIKPIVSAVLK